MTSIKKHITDMSNDEKQFLFQELKKVPYWIRTDYFNQRLANRSIHWKQVTELVQFGDIIEFHKKHEKNRVLIRGKKMYNQQVVCAVFEFETNQIITAYWNRFDDIHLTLDKNRYTDKIKVLEYFSFHRT